MRTKIYQVKPTGNIIMKNITGEIKNTINWLNNNRNKGEIPEEKLVEELRQKILKGINRSREWEETGQTEDWKRGKIYVEIMTGCLIIKGKCKISD